KTNIFELLNDESVEIVNTGTPSSLGSSNLSKMKLDFSYSYTPGTYSDYPSSYPPTDPRRQSLHNSNSSQQSTSYDSVTSRILNKSRYKFQSDDQINIKLSDSEIINKSE